ncbi:MAG: decaprenyl-phosphate phosphoribosyltransferase [Actinobacteria bacterium]|nr:decaprenyl-phosphate phosphoribosyltransferase [Actinomycetota bacterium]
MQVTGEPRRATRPRGRAGSERSRAGAEPSRARAEPSACDGPGARPRSRAAALLAEARPRQWVKNLLVVSAPGASGMLRQGDVIWRTALTFVAFCLVASGTYYLNDVRDVAADRRHPSKRLRPVAAGEIPLGVARAVGLVLLAGGLGLAVAVAWQLGVVVATYVVLTASYTVWLKHVAVVDMVSVAAGFVLRALAGGAATGIEISEWFFIMTIFGSLFMVSGKRQAELDEMGDDAPGTRAALGQYTSSYLAYLRAVSSGVVFVAYSLWAFEKADLSSSSIPWFQLSIVPWILALLRYALLVDAGRGGAPEELVLGDRALQVFGIIWLAVFAAGIYVG